ncbi:MAG: hypothetical protein V3W43_15695 [Desulfatiglandaceae bacterium]
MRKAYLELARKDQERFVVIDATLAEDDVEKDIFRHVRPLLSGMRKKDG